MITIGIISITAETTAWPTIMLLLLLHQLHITITAK